MPWTLAWTFGIPVKASWFQVNLIAKYANPDSLWFEPQEDNVDNKLDALCPSEPKWGSSLIKLAEFL